MTPQERSAKSAQKRKALNEVEYRLSVSKGVKGLLVDLMRHAGIKEQGEALTLPVHHLHALGQKAAAKAMGRQILIGNDGAKREEIRFRARPGTQKVIADLMAWGDLETPGDLFEVVILRMIELGHAGANPLLTPPRHEIIVSEKVARILQRKGRREALEIEREETAVWNDLPPALAGQLTLIGDHDDD